MPRATRSIWSECSSLRFSTMIRPGVGLSIRNSQSISSPFSTLNRFSSAEAPAPSTPPKATPTPYVRKSAVLKPAAAVSKQAAKAASIDDQSSIQDMTTGLADEPLLLDEDSRQVDWTRSFHGLSAAPFSKEAADVLMAPIPFDDVEVKPDGIIYLPEIKYRRILNKAFGPGAWGLAPRGETIVTAKSITREYALVAHGRYVHHLHSSPCSF